MAQAGIVTKIEGSVTARTPDGEIRQLMVGDVVYENEIIQTAAGAQLTIELNDGRTLDLAEGSQLAIDETVVAAVDPQDAVLAEVQELQAALEAGEDIPEEETAAGVEDDGYDYVLAYNEGDQSGGTPDSYLFGTEYGSQEDEELPDPDGEVEQDATLAPESESESGPESEGRSEIRPDSDSESVFIVGSNPESDSGADDAAGTSESDYHVVNPAGDTVQGAISGQDGADILVGDPGSVSAESVSVNYILVMDYSHSVTSTLDNLFSAIESTVQTLYNQVMQAYDGYEITINLLPFAQQADYDDNSAWISFTNENGEVVIDGSINSATGTLSIDSIAQIISWISDSATLSEVGATTRTNYDLAFTEAQDCVDGDADQNNVIFISDGLYNTGGSYTDSLNALLGMDDNILIRAVGIDMTSGTLPEYDMNNIDSTGTAISTDFDHLSDVLVDLTPEVSQDFSLDPAGSDSIYGDDGDDIIFGDALNTDDVFDDLADNYGYDLSGITEPHDGSGWEVFDTLENELSTWTREDTLQYIQDNHAALAEETVLEDSDTREGSAVREGGNDYIEGGAGDDIIYGQEGDDTIDSGSGDDVVDGGSGFDTLVVTSETQLDFSHVSNIESIHMDESGVDQTITLSLDQVLNMTDEDNTLQFTGETGDSVILTGVDGGEWTHDGNGLFTNVDDASIQVTLVSVDDSVDIDVDVDNGDTFQV